MLYSNVKCEDEHTLTQLSVNNTVKLIRGVEVGVGVGIGNMDCDLEGVPSPSIANAWGAPVDRVQRHARHAKVRSRVRRTGTWYLWADDTAFSRSWVPSSP